MADFLFRSFGHNVITVGAVDDKNTTDTADDTLATFSSFLEESGLPNKPDLCAPGVLIATSSHPYEYFDYPYNNFEVSGTSFAAPHVTGIIAQLLDAKPSLIVLQDTVKAILSASVYRSNVQYKAFNHIQFIEKFMHSIGGEQTLFIHPFLNGEFLKEDSEKDLETIQERLDACLIDG